MLQWQAATERAISCLDQRLLGPTAQPWSRLMTARSAAPCYCSNASRPAAQPAQYASCLRVTRALAPCTRAQALVRRWRSCRA